MTISFHCPQQPTSQQCEEDLPLVLIDLKKSLDGISSAFAVYNDCAQRLRERSSPLPTFQKEVIAFSKEIERQESNQREAFDRIIGGVENNITKQLELALGLSDLIREETATIVKEEVDIQIKDHLPVSLKEQAKESTKQLQEIRISLMNSEARTQNSYVERTRLDETLVPVLTPNGEKSPHYPPTIESLFGYDLEKAKALSTDYGLTDSDDVRTHFQQFLKHIGTSVDVVIPNGDLETMTIDLEELDN